MADEWRETRVGDLVNQGALVISDGYRVRNSELGPEGIPFVRGGDIGDGWIDTNTKDHIRPEFVDRVRAKLTQTGDAAFITKGTVGRAGRLRPGQPTVVFAPQVAYWRVVDRNALDPDFIFYLMRGHDFQSALDAVKTHGAMAADYVSISQQHDFRFRLPRVEVQRVIAHILGTLDDKIELNRRMNETLEAMARALFKSWFVDFDPVRAKAEGRDPGLPESVADLFPNRLVDSELGEIPEGWSARPLDRIAQFQNGLALQRFRPSQREERLPVVKIAQLRRGVADSNEWASAGIRSECIIDDGDVVFSWSGSLLVRIWCGGRAALNQHLFKVTSDEFPRWFYLRAVLSHLTEFQRIASGKATTMGHIKRRHLAEAHCAVPDKIFLEKIAPLFAIVDGRWVASEIESRTLGTLRDALLPKLISGELRVEDTERFVEGANR